MHGRLKFVCCRNSSTAKHGRNFTPISPIAFEAVKSIDKLVDIDREINDLSAEERLQRRRNVSLLLVAELERWMRVERTSRSRSSPLTEERHTQRYRFPDLARRRPRRNRRYVDQQGELARFV
ncbi:TPA: transposase [Klebsiella pneumoniae]|nr:transposase [Klebsiella pneumoniae]HDK6042827.1 transposase [Klebsiella pneumoniae]